MVISRLLQSWITTHLFTTQTHLIQINRELIDQLSSHTRRSFQHARHVNARIIVTVQLEQAVKRGNCELNAVFAVLKLVKLMQKQSTHFIISMSLFFTPLP